MLIGLAFLAGVAGVLVTLGAVHLYRDHHVFHRDHQALMEALTYINQGIAAGQLPPPVKAPPPPAPPAK